MAPIPVPDQDIICLGINYLAHAEESARLKKEAFSKPDQAVYFSKRVNRATDPGDGIPSHKELTSQLDYEAELADDLEKGCEGRGFGGCGGLYFRLYHYERRQRQGGADGPTDSGISERAWTDLRPWGPGSSPPTAWNFRRSSRSSPGSTENCARIPTRISSFTGSQKWSVS